MSFYAFILSLYGMVLFAGIPFAILNRAQRRSRYCPRCGAAMRAEEARAEEAGYH